MAPTMVSSTSILLPLLLLATLHSTPTLCYVNPAAPVAQKDDTKTSAGRTYIVLVEPPHLADQYAHRQWHESFLPSPCADVSGNPCLLHSYTEAFSGFAARLTDVELDMVAKKPGFVRAFPERMLQPMTTHTPEFLGLRTGTGFWSDAGYGKGVIVGLLDTGIYAKHPSFDDHGVPPPPARWKGSCKAERCNNKLIGAVSFVGDHNSDDDEGHGTHTSSTAAGNFVAGASSHAVGVGTAAGIAPAAHIAMYKVCNSLGCTESSVLAGLDKAIKDGVDVLSISLGGGSSFRFDQDPIAMATFKAVSKGIIVVCSAGNNGPTSGSITNDAPWLLTVAAGSVDRSFDAAVHLGNGKSIDGQALNQVVKPSSEPYPLLYSEERRQCDYAGESSIVGKIVVCEFVLGQEFEIHGIISAGAAGVVLFNNKAIDYTTVLADYNSTVVQVTAADGVVLTNYARSTGSSKAALSYNNTVLGIRPAPVVASFSSRGPSRSGPGVLKPDILAPGLNILAAWPPRTDGGSGPFNVLSGTSMSTPHVSGVAALIKSVHPGWSPAAIKSAIVTTADVVNSTGGSILDEQHRKASVFAAGAGHVNPARAADPGLVYDIDANEYAGYLCWLIGDAGPATIVGNSSLPCKTLPKVSDLQLNYPTITVPLTSTSFIVNRTVTNVGPALSTYTAKIDAPKSLEVRVLPNTLAFSKAGEKKTFSVSVSGNNAKELFLEASLSWVSGKHVVRSPIVAVSGPAPTPPSPGRTSLPWDGCNFPCI